MITYFVLARGVGDIDLAKVVAVVAATPGLEQARVYTPASTSDPYLNDGTPPALGLQLYFADIADLEAGLAVGGALEPLVGLLAAFSVTQQAMLARRFPVPDAVFRTAAGAPHCSYLVAYEGPAEDMNLWLSHYIAHHPPIMARFPGIREIEISSRIDWCGFLPWARADDMQRNKVVFDDAAGLTAALNSPVRHEMRADFKEFPKFAGGNTHFPMLTTVLLPSGG